jgi:hypothetical protein
MVTLGREEEVGLVVDLTWRILRLRRAVVLSRHLEEKLEKVKVDENFDVAPRENVKGVRWVVDECAAVTGDVGGKIMEILA